MVDYNMSWEDFFARLARFDKPGELVYGVPRGGVCAAAFLRKAKITHRIGDASLILDDIVDSGATRSRYQQAYPNTLFEAIVDKQNKDCGDHRLGWVKFPFEKAEEDSVEDCARHLLQRLGAPDEGEMFISIKGKKPYNRTIFL